LVFVDRLRVSREYFNSAMGIVPNRNAGRPRSSDKDDEEGQTACTCKYRDPFSLPRKGSKEARADSAAGRSWNCGEDCINRLLKIECTDATCGLAHTDQTNSCGNRLFTRGSYYPGVRPFKTEFKGWGLYCPDSNIPAGAFIHEYVGEVIDQIECQRRMDAEHEKCRYENEMEMKRREEIRKKEEKIRNAELKAKWKAEEAIAKSNPNGYHPRTTTKSSEIIPRQNSARIKKKEVEKEKTKVAEKAAAAAAAAAAKKSKKKGKGGKSSRKHSASAESSSDTSDSDDSDDDDNSFIEGSGPRAANFYFLVLCSDIIIDAGVQGGHARFTNHSCNPNCHIEKWMVNGQARIGIFANQDIPKGKELTIDYQYDRKGHKQACYCGEANCAGFIGGKKAVTAESLSAAAAAAAKKAGKKVKDPIRLHLDDYDEVCCMCGDGGDLMMCDAKVCGKFCTRGYHAACILYEDESDIPKRWICPYHQCDACGSHTPRYFCATCNESACERCWKKSRLDEPEEGEPRVEKEGAGSANAWAIFHQTRMRRDLPNYHRNVWTCCSTCQVDPMCLRETERAELYSELAAAMVIAILERRADPTQVGFGGDESPDRLVELMDSGEFTPTYQHYYWQCINPNSMGKWTDGYISPAKRGLVIEPEKETDEEWLERTYAEAQQARGDDSSEEDEEDHEEEKKEWEAKPDAAPASASATAVPVVAAEVVVASNEPVPMELDNDDDDDVPAPSAHRRGRPDNRGTATDVTPAVRKRGRETASASSAAVAAAAKPVQVASSHPIKQQRNQCREDEHKSQFRPNSIAAAAAAAAAVFVTRSSRSARDSTSTAAVVPVSASVVSAAVSSANKRKRSALVSSPVELVETESSSDSGDSDEVDTTDAVLSKRSKLNHSTSARPVRAAANRLSLSLTHVSEKKQIQIAQQLSLAAAAVASIDMDSIRAQEVESPPIKTEKSWRVKVADTFGNLARTFRGSNKPNMNTNKR
jgi:hypothetical protein